MVTDRVRKRLPPYISYRTFRNFMERLQQGVPSRIDRSYWGDMLSGGTGTQLMAALRFLALIDAGGKPTGKLKALAAARGEQKTEVLREITAEAFSFVLHGSLDPHNATYAQLEELFRETFQPTDDVCRKCIKFFVSLADEARIPLSPFITKKLRSTHAVSGTKTTGRKTAARMKRNLTIPQDLEKIPEQKTWDKMLLAKFPEFDPAWNDEVKLKWFAAFEELMKRFRGTDIRDAPQL